MLFLPFKIAIKVISLLITALVAYLVLSAVQVALASRATSNPADLHPSSAIVVDGPYEDSGALGSDLTDRLQTAGILYAAHLAPRVVVSLVGDPASRASATGAITTLLQQSGVPASAITPLSATSGTDGLKQIAQTLGPEATTLIVTDAIDVLWTKGAATSAGLEPVIVPATHSKVGLYTEVGPLVRETSGVAAGRIIGDLRATWAAD
jgi:hypothetical protein